MIVRALLSVMALFLAAGSAWAQVDLSGNWAPLYHEDQPERIPGPEIGDYLGLPITEAARAKAHAWSASLLTLPEHQCKPHPAGYGFRGPSNLRIQQEVDRQTQRVEKITVYLMWMQQYREIWMDGRPHPSEYAPHTWQGFSTGRWEGQTLVVTTSHMKAGWVRRNGVIYSDWARFTDRWIRHGNYLTHMSVLEDPVYLTEPFVRTTNWVLAPEQRIDPYPCDVVDEIADHELGQVPHYLPGTNNMLTEFSTRQKLSPIWAEGGAETALPEYQAVMRRAPAAAAVRPGRPASASPAAAAASGGSSSGASPGPVAPAHIPDTTASGEIVILPVQGNVYMLAGAGANIAVQVGSDGVLVVDSGTAARAEKVLAAIRTLAGGKPIRYVINTHADPENTGGNEALRGAGEAVAGGDFARNIQDAGEGATILAHEEVQVRMGQTAAGQPARPFRSWPTETFFTAKKEIFFNGEGIQILHLPHAHTDGDVMVYFRKSDVLVAGDVFSTESYPVVHVDAGGSVNGVVAALNRIIDTTIPREKQEGGTYVIPSRGRIVDESDVVDYRDMVTILRDRIQDLVKKGMTLEQVKAANLTLDYDGRWGTDSASTTNAFIAAAYASLRPASR